MSNTYSYFNYDGSPCRIEALKGDEGEAEIYHAGVGFVPAPKMDILFHATPISKAECEALILAMVRENKTDA